MNPQQNNFIASKMKHYRKHLPKGSYHSYCRNRIYESHPEEFLRQDLTRLNQKTSQTQREKHSLLDSAQTFEEYLSYIERPNTVAMQQISRRNKEKQRNRGVSQTKENLKKIDNEEIIDSHLPFFKCKLEKTEFLIKRPDFRVKDQKFKVNRNVVENNLHYFMSNSMPLKRT